MLEQRRHDSLIFPHTPPLLVLLLKQSPKEDDYDDDDEDADGDDRKVEPLSQMCVLYLCLDRV